MDIASEAFQQESGTKYITSTLYDYYTDYELNGLNRDTYPDITTLSQRGFVTFEQFNRALSSAYEQTAMSNTRFIPGISNRHYGITPLQPLPRVWGYTAGVM